MSANSRVNPEINYVNPPIATRFQGFFKTLISYWPLCDAIVMQDYVTEHSILACVGRKIALAQPIF